VRKFKIDMRKGRKREIRSICEGKGAEECHPFLGAMIPP
jgi:hypothetical protein